MPIPPEIQALTGITNAMVRDAPPFRAIADEVAARTANAVFVANGIVVALLAVVAIVVLVIALR